MSDFIKCECPHCGQNIEYPSEGTGETVPCPTCGKSVTLTSAIQPQASDEAQRKKDWDEWMALNERLKERRIQSGIAPQEEVPIQEAVKPQIIPALFVQNSPPRRRVVRKPREVKILTPMESLSKWLDWRITENKMCVGCDWLPAGPLGYAFPRNTFLTIGLSVQIASAVLSPFEPLIVK